MSNSQFVYLVAVALACKLYTLDLPGIDDKSQRRLMEFGDMVLKSTILDMFKEVANQQSKTVDNLDDNLVLLNSGLDSLCFAIIVARLEEKLGFDPFSANDNVEYPVTFADLVRCYERPAAQ
jgi:acyl carrier protein